MSSGPLAVRSPAARTCALVRRRAAHYACAALELLGPFGILFFAGLALWALGFLIVWRMLAKHGGLDRQKTLHVVFDDDSPMKAPEAKGDRMTFRIGVFMGAIGLMTLFTGISVGDARELRVCVQKCQLAGYVGGKFAPSAIDKDPSGKPRRGCFCTTPTGSIELQRDQLPSVPSAPADAPRRLPRGDSPRIGRGRRARADGRGVTRRTRAPRQRPARPVCPARRAVRSRRPPRRPCAAAAPAA